MGDTDIYTCYPARACSETELISKRRVGVCKMRGRYYRIEEGMGDAVQVDASADRV